MTTANIRVVPGSSFARAKQTLAGEVAWERADRIWGLGRSDNAHLADDDDEMVVAPADLRESAALGYHFTYLDRHGHQTERIVSLRRIDLSSDGLKLWCWCHLRRAVRQFAVDRITQVFCVVTGEVFDDAADYFSRHPMLREPQDPEGYALKVCRHEVNILMLLAAADGYFCPSEQEKILIHVYDRLPDLQLDEQRLRNRLAKIVPDEVAYENAIFRMTRFGDGDARALTRSVRKLIEADGQLTEEEILFTSELQQRLSIRSGSA